MEMMNASSLKELEVQKTRELREIQQYQAGAVEATLKKKEQSLLELEDKFQQLRGDFEYNLKLLEERDKELSQYDEVFEQLKNVINSKSAEISELYIRIDQLTNQIAGFEQEKADLRRHYTERVAELQQQTTSFQQQCHASADKERSHYEQLCTQLQHRLSLCEEESERIREESGRDLEELLRHKDQEHRLKIDEMVTMVMTKESQIKQLSRQVATCKASLEQSSQRETTSEVLMKKMKQEVKKKEWTMVDEINAKDTRIAQLEEQLEQVKCSLRKCRSEYELRHAEMDRKVREKVVAMAAAKESHTQTRKQLEDHVSRLRSQMEKLKLELRQSSYCHGDQLTEAKHAVEKAKEELIVARQQHSNHVKQISEDHVSQQLQIQSLTESNEQLRTQLVSRQQEIEKYQEQVSTGLRREHQLEQSLTQLQLDTEQHKEQWQGRQLDRQQQIVDQLTVARDDALATVKKVEADLLDCNKQITQLAKERDVAMATLQQHGLTMDDSVVAMDNQEVVKLHQQNNELRHVISEMRREMEVMSSEVVEGENPAAMATKGYVEFMEKELAKVKSENRQLLSNLEAAEKDSKPSHDGHHGNRDAATNEVATLETKLLEYSRTISNMEQEKLKLMMTCERLTSHRRRLEAALKFCHSHSMMTSSDDHAPTEALSTHQQLHRKLSKATQVIIELVGQKEQLLTIVTKLRDKVRSYEQVKTRTVQGDKSQSAQITTDNKTTHKHSTGSHGINKQSIHSTPLHGAHSSSSHHGNSDKLVTSDGSLQVTDSFELSCQQHHEALEKLLNTATAGGLLSSDDDHVPSNSGSFVVRGRSLAHKRPPAGRTHKSRDHMTQQQTTRRVRKPEK